MSVVYVLQSELNCRYYIGSTKNLTRRLEEHNSGKSKYTSFSKPFRLVFSQEFPSLFEARRIEYRLKKFKSRKILEKIIKDGFIKIQIIRGPVA